MTTREPPLTYADAGVDTARGAALVDRIRPHVASTRRPGADGTIGGFGGVFDLAAARYRDPLLVSATDGVGTKLRLAIESGRHDKIGIDLVAMCVNDLVVQGAEPLFFLDYLASGRLRGERDEAIVSGIAEGCRRAGCALIGGETAEMPGMYAAEDYDLAGFAVGAVERDALLPRDIRAGDAIVGLASSGPHSNGYSLVREVVARSGLALDAPAPFASETLAETLLAPTRIYVKPILQVLKAHRGLRGFAHITGGGLVENVPRVLPDGLAARLDLDALRVPDVFRWLAKAGPIEAEEMLRTFNCGVGMVAIVAEGDAEALIASLNAAGERAFAFGSVVEGEGEAIALTGRLAL